MKHMGTKIALASLLVTGLALANIEKDHVQHEGHTHVHGPKCGHKTVKHDDHVDYVHDNHRHAAHETHYDEHGTVNAEKNH